MDDFEDATFLTAMSRALSVTTNKPKHLVDMLNEKLASVTPRRIINESIPVAAEAGSPRTRPISEPERPRPAEVKEGKKRNVTWRDSVGDSLCEEAWYPDTEEWGSRDGDVCGVSRNTSKGDEYEDDDDKESNSDEPDFPVHSTPRPKSPASNTSTSSTSPPAHAGLPLVQWSSGPTPIPRLRFTAISFLLTQRQASRMPPHPSVAQWRAGDGDPPMKLSYRIVGGTECQIVRATLVANGFKEAGPTQDDYNVMWANNKVDVHEIRSLNRYQKVNRFPRTNEITRKDKLYLNISRMKQTYGERHFDFLPPTFLLPQEYEPFYTCYLRTGGRWIVKPVASSQGRGIHVIDSLAELPSRLNADDKYLIQKYIDNPLLLNGYKFDLRIYVAITSFSPLRIYMFEEGLARVATERYDTNPIHSNRSCMHLTNSAINKQSENYVDNEDASQDDHGNKWSLTALMRYITSKYGSDNASLIKSKIKDIIVKSILSGEATVSTAVNMFVQHTGNCFELLGFDILIDENLTPWLLEINLSPSLACDTPLDLKIKSALIADLFTMVE
ncbi:tubulin-tyrosine ligase family-domain-containing protein [Chytridium lagenaria]|nr:tubulin-tyrosine ligase family-domain-containing protein [Chytridium lagenaria]